MPPEPDFALPDLRCETHTLANGLRVLLHCDRRLPLVTVNLWYHVGSKNEQAGRTGLAHLFEHMLFQGSEHVGTQDHFRLIQEAGGVANGSTWYDRTNYYETLPANHLDLALWMESDRMGFLLPALDQKKLDTQRDVVMNERRQRVDNQPYGRAWERLHELLYPPHHPYRWPVIGAMEDIAAATLEDLTEFFATFYTPRNAVLCLAGDFDPDEALARVESYFGEIPGGAPPPQADSFARGTTAPAQDELRDRVQLPRLYLGSRAPAYGQRDWYAGSLLAIALAGGKSSPLHQDLVVRRQIAQDVSVHIFPTELEATFAVVATAKPGVAPEELERALDEHLTRAAEPLPEAEVARARNQVLTSFFGALETSEGIADMLSQWTTYFGDPGWLRHELATYTQLTAEDLASFARRYCGSDHRVVLAVLPAEGPA